MVNTNLKPVLKIVLLPSLLTVSLALTACNNAATSNDTNVESTANNTTVQSTPAPDDLSDEEKMITDLARYRWTLVTATDESKQPVTSLMDIKDQVVLSFNKYQGQNTVSYSVGCNTVNAAYQLQDYILMIEDGMSTKMLCDDLNTAENELNELMQGESQISLVGLVDGTSPILTQVTSDSTTLVWNGRMTAQAKYNSKGETIFWAVNANTKPCTDASEQACLQVKPITYDDQGIKTDEGEWTEFMGNIDGYQYDGKHDEVLRLQRYKLEATDEASEKYAYVLDMVIESAVAS